MSGKHWRDDAACRMADARLFDPLDQADGHVGAAGGMPSGFVARIVEARAICASCPVKNECYADAIRSNDSGVRGGVLLQHGKATDERQRIFKEQAAFERERRIVAANARAYRDRHAA